MTQGRRPSIEFDEATLLRALAARITRSPPLAPDVPPWPGRVAPPCLPAIIRLGMSNATLLSPAGSRTFLGLDWPERLSPPQVAPVQACRGVWSCAARRAACCSTSLGLHVH